MRTGANAFCYLDIYVCTCLCVRVLVYVCVCLGALAHACALYVRRWVGGWSGTHYCFMFCMPGHGANPCRSGVLGEFFEALVSHYAQPECQQAAPNETCLPSRVSHPLVGLASTIAEAGAEAICSQSSEALPCQPRHDT